jgi:hypothetical protein
MFPKIFSFSGIHRDRNCTVSNYKFCETHNCTFHSGNFSKKLCLFEKTRVVDPYSFFPDPDPEYDVGDQYGSGSGSNADPGL